MSYFAICIASLIVFALLLSQSCYRILHTNGFIFAPVAPMDRAAVS
jgi:hypothetical protein